MDHIFKKGDEVPGWIMKTENINLAFETDVKAFVDDNGVKLYPLSSEFAQLISGRTIDEGAPISIVGAPSFLLTYNREVSHSA